MAVVSHPVGVCSWSLQPAHPADLAAKVRECGLSAVQLALDPIRDGSWSLDDTRKALDGISILSGMMMMGGEDYSTLDAISRTGGVRPDATWEANLAAAHQNAEIAEALGLSLVTFHAGVIPHNPQDPERATIMGRVAEIVDAFQSRGLGVAFETGQESADTMLGVLGELGKDNLGVNFDPANMILYGTGDPIEALRLLMPHVNQVHIKDARWTKTPGTWGEETPAGEGEVDWDAFCALLRDHHPDVGVVIEREGGDKRVADVRTALDLVRARLPIGGGTL